MAKKQSAKSKDVSMAHFKEAVHFLLDDLENILGIKNINGNVRLLSMNIREFDKKYKTFIDGLNREDKLVMLKRASEALTTLSYINHKTTFFRVEVLSFKQHGRFDILRVLLKAFSHRDAINKNTLINIDSLIEYLEILEGYNSKNINTFSYKFIRIFIAMVSLGDFSQASIVSGFITSQIDVCLNLDNYKGLNEQELENARRKIVEQRDELSRNGKISSDPNINLRKGEFSEEHEDASDTEVKEYVDAKKGGASTDDVVATPEKGLTGRVKDKIKNTASDAGIVINSNVFSIDKEKFKNKVTGNTRGFDSETNKEEKVVNNSTSEKPTESEFKIEKEVEETKLEEVNVPKEKEKSKPSEPKIDLSKFTKLREVDF